jgi:secondary thiamine-phosphate synthase enzyme
MNIQEFSVRTRTRTEFLDISAQVSKIVQECNVQSGLAVVFVPHTTAAVTINENADPSVQHDLLADLNRLIPFAGPYQHSEGNSAAHIKSSLVGPSETLLIDNGRLALGTWQGVYFCEFDGPRTRKVWVKIISD